MSTELIQVGKEALARGAWQEARAKFGEAAAGHTREFIST